MLKISHVRPHLLKGSLYPHMRRNFRIMIKLLNSQFPNNLIFETISNLSLFTQKLKKKEDKST